MTLMLIRLYLIPFALMLSSLLAAFILKIYIPTHMGGSLLFASLTSLSIQVAPWISIGLASFALIGFLIQTYSLWQWSQGQTDACLKCGGMVTYKVGRFGPYHKCFLCGGNTSL